MTHLLFPTYLAWFLPSSSGKAILSVLSFLPAPLYQFTPIASFRPCLALIALRKHFPINLPRSVRCPMSPGNIIVLCHFILVDTLLVIAFIIIIIIVSLSLHLLLFNLSTFFSMCPAFLLRESYSVDLSTQRQYTPHWIGPQ